jgi:hypothetical protein
VQTTGPFLLAVGTPLTEYDPAGSYQPASAYVQVQNNSGFQLIVNGGGQQYSVNPFTQTTLPTNGAALFIIDAYNVLSNFGGSVTLVWLQQGESAPSPDGTLFAPNTNQGGLSSVQNTVVGGVGTVLLPNPPVGYAYRLQSACFIETEGPIAAAAYIYLVTGTSIIIMSTDMEAGRYFAQTVLLNGQLCSSKIVGATNLPSYGVSTTLNYDLVQV